MADVDSKLYTVDKQALLRALARRRQAARWPGYGCIGDYRQGRYECDAVSPYTKTAKNTDARFCSALGTSPRTLDIPRILRFLERNRTLALSRQCVVLVVFMDSSP
jgi:hypothetical protein